MNPTETIFEVLENFGHLSQEERELIAARLEKLEMTKGHCFYKAGSLVTRFYFLVDGVVRISVPDNVSKDKTRYFITKDHFFTDLKSFHYQDRAVANCEAITDCSCLFLTYDSYMFLQDNIPNWQSIFDRLINTYYTAKVELARQLISLDATERYNHFLTCHPGLANFIPQAMLASYLGITASSLSRIRRSFS
jgi:CRP-like cAMP-binding protein